MIWMVLGVILVIQLAEKPFLNWINGRGVACFFMGCLLGRFYQNVDKYNKVCIGNISFGILCICLVMATIKGYEVFGENIRVSLILGLAPLVIVWALFSPPVARVLTLKPLLWLGKRSFSIYVWHFPMQIIIKDPISCYLDLIKYHTNYEALANEDAWHMIDNRQKSDNKGCRIQGGWCYFETPHDFQIDNRWPLSDTPIAILNKLLDYCDRNQIKVLFVVCPYAINESEYSVYNSLGDIITKRGYGFVNFNDYYEEMNVDFSTDFYNGDHMNAIGAEKYTRFLAEYVQRNYGVGSSDRVYDKEQWQSLCKEFSQESLEIKKEVYDEIFEAKKASNMGKTIRTATDFAEWGNYVNDEHYSLLVVGNGKYLEDCTVSDRRVFEYLGFDYNDLVSRNSVAKVLIDDICLIEEPEAINNQIQTPIGLFVKHSEAEIDGSNMRCSIKIDGIEYSRQDSEGLNIVVFDNYFRKVIDSVTLSAKEGQVVLER